jgi:tRNA(Arg) A34 adenosine deaminase TadA
MRSFARPSTASGHTRRKFIAGSLRWLYAPAFIAVSKAGPTSTGENLPDIRQPGRVDREQFMKRAFDLRRVAQQRGDQAYGAVVVKDGKIAGEGISSVLVRPDPTAHGEVEAIRDAARRLGTNDLNGCEIYSTAKPCPMCETACYWARISRIYYGSAIADGGAPRYAAC